MNNSGKAVVGTRPPRIFISYAHEDSKMALRLFDRLKKAGFDPWMDRKSMLPGEIWRQKIPDAVRSADFFIAVFSPESVSKKGYVQKEYKIALDVLTERGVDDVFVIPVRLGECEIPDIRVNEYSPSMRDLQWMELPIDREWTDADLDTLIKTVDAYGWSSRDPEPASKASEPEKPKRQWPVPDPLDQSIFESMKARDLPYTDDILVLLHETPSSELRVNAERAYDAYHEMKVEKLGGLPLLDCFLIARHLYRAIGDNQPKVCRRRPFTFPIHQFLSGMIRSSDPAERDSLTRILRQWLMGMQSTYQTARDFAAFELGMCRDRAAVQELLECVRNPDELSLVRYYGAMSLGMIGDRSVVDSLGALAETTPNLQLRTLFLHIIYYLERL